jgi:hypothetical protein
MLHEILAPKHNFVFYLVEGGVHLVGNEHGAGREGGSFGETKLGCCSSSSPRHAGKNILTTNLGEKPMSSIHLLDTILHGV